MGEHQLDKLGVTGSSPVPPTRRSKAGALPGAQGGDVYGSRRRLGQPGESKETEVTLGGELPSPRGSQLLSRVAEAALSRSPAKPRATRQALGLREGGAAVGRLLGDRGRVSRDLRW